MTDVSLDGKSPEINLDKTASAGITSADIVGKYTPDDVPTNQRKAWSEQALVAFVVVCFCILMVVCVMCSPRKDLSAGGAFLMYVSAAIIGYLVYLTYYNLYVKYNKGNYAISIGMLVFAVIIFIGSFAERQTKKIGRVVEDAKEKKEIEKAKKKLEKIEKEAEEAKAARKTRKMAKKAKKQAEKAKAAKKARREAEKAKAAEKAKSARKAKAAEKVEESESEQEENSQKKRAGHKTSSA